MVRGEGDPARAARLSWAWVGWKDEGEGEDSEGAMLGWAGLGWRSGGRERVGSAAGVTDRRSIGSARIGVGGLHLAQRYNHLP